MSGHRLPAVIAASANDVLTLALAIAVGLACLFAGIQTLGRRGPTRDLPPWLRVLVAVLAFVAAALSLLFAFALGTCVFGPGFMR